jgi:hypothetical protein
VIFADEPALMPHVRYYQRLLARDEDEASALVSGKLTELGVVGMMDTVLIPALSLAIQHRGEGEIDPDDFDFIVTATTEFVEQLKAAQPALPESQPRIIGLAARTQIDQLVLDMLCIGVNSADIPLQAVDSSLEPAAALEQAVAQRPQVACIVALSPTRGAEVRNSCRKLRAERPDSKLLVLRPIPPEGDVGKSSARMREAGADCVASTIQEAMTELARLSPSQTLQRAAEQDVRRAVLALAE